MSFEASYPVPANTGGGGGVTTVGSFDGQSPSVDGATISGSSIYFQSADATHPGMIAASGSQTLTPDFIFEGTLTLDGASSAIVSASNLGSNAAPVIGFNDGGGNYSGMYFTNSGNAVKVVATGFNVNFGSGFDPVAFTGNQSVLPYQLYLNGAAASPHDCVIAGGTSTDTLTIAGDALGGTSKGGAIKMGYGTSTNATTQFYNAGVLSGSFDSSNYLNLTTGMKNAAPQTTLNGSAGTAVCSQPEQGSSYKKVVVYLSGYTDTGTQSYTYPTAFSHTPYVYGATGGVAGATATTTAVTFTVTTQTGFVFIEGY